MRRKAKFPKPAMIDVQGVLGNFKVPHADLTVEYVLTYSPLDGGLTSNGRLLDLLVPVREAFKLSDLDFDQLLQRDLDDYRVSGEMIPYLLGKTSSDPRFFPPIVAVIIPMTGTTMAGLYPPCNKSTETEDDIELQAFNYGDVFSVRRETQNGQLAQSSVDISINPTKANLVIVDGQHRAMAMLATYRNALNRWRGNEFQHFYQIDETIELSDLDQIHLPVCITYFPELTEDGNTETVTNLTTACRKFFLDINRNARKPSQARQILLDDTDLIACFTRHLFNMVQKGTKNGTLRLHHTEYDNPHDRTPIIRPFALTTVYTIYNIIRSVLLMPDDRVRNPMASYGSSGRPAQNKPRLRRELDLENVLTEEIKDQLLIKIANIEQDDYPSQGEAIFRQCFEMMWGEAILTSLSKFYPYQIHIRAVDTVLDEHEPYIGANHIARTALVDGQGLRYTLEMQQKHDKERGLSNENSNAQKAWAALQKIEAAFEERRAMFYLNLDSIPDGETIKKVNRIFDCFRSSAFQNGLLMAFACLKDRLNIDDRQDFLKCVDKWINRINKKFQTVEGTKAVLFDYWNPTSLRHIYKPQGGLTPSDAPFFRYIALELLSVQTGNERQVTDQAKEGWRQKLYKNLYARKQGSSSEVVVEEDARDYLDSLTFAEIVKAFNSSLDIDEGEIKRDLHEVRNTAPQADMEIEDEDDTDEFSEPQ